jgi:hypothetical protein
MRRKIKFLWGHGFVLVSTALALLLCLVSAGCGGEECDEKNLDSCKEDCHDQYTDLSEIILHNECVYYCYLDNGCDPTCAGTCFHEKCTTEEDVISYARCQDDCKIECGE